MSGCEIRQLLARAGGFGCYSHCQISCAMNQPLASAEAVFVLAVELPAGVARDKFVAVQCAGDPALRREVESLLRAHDEAGDFLRAPSERPDAHRSRAATIPLQGTATLNAAAHAEVFLHDAGENAGGRIEAYIAKLPEAVRREARERIEAGLRVRQLRAWAEPPFAEREEPPPRARRGAQGRRPR